MVEVMVFDIKTTVTRHLNYLVFPTFFYAKESSIDPLGWNRLDRVHISIGMSFNIDNRHTPASAHICSIRPGCVLFLSFNGVLLASNEFFVRNLKQ